MIDVRAGDWDCLVLLGDCLDWLPELEPDSVDLIITDPPYESLERHRAVGTTTRLKKSKASSNPWFNCFPNTSYFQLFQRLYAAGAKDSHCYVFCDSETEHVILTGRNPYDAKLDQALHDYLFPPRSCFDGFLYEYRTGPKGPWTAWPTLTWTKTKRGIETQDGDEVEYDMLSPGMGYHWRRTGERILFLEKGKKKLNNLGWPDALLGPKAGRADFPTAKPAGVVARLIENSSATGDVVLDPFAGSGIVATEALRLGRRAVLIEKYPSDWLVAAHPPTERCIWRHYGQP